MTQDKSLVNAKLEALRQEYGAQLAGKIQLMELVWTEASKDPRSSAAFDDFHRIAHSLAGSAGTFGYDLISELARDIEARCDEILDLDAPTAAERTEHISELLAQLGPAVNITRTSKEGGYGTSERASAPRRRDKLIALFDSDPEQAQALAVQIEESGYCVRVFLDPDSAIEVLADAPPAAILMSLYFVKGRKYGIEAAQQIRERSAERFPLIFLSTSNDFETRLSAIRAGADGYLVKPPRLASLIDLLDRAILGRSARPCHVLVFTSDDATASQIRSTLEADGMVVHVLHDTAQAIETLRRFQPEVILADAYMPQCTGLELAQVIRQDDAYAAIPIVFLVNGFVGSSNLLGVGLEDGDYLVKSFEPSVLVELVAMRAQRARVDRAALAKDNLSKVLSQPTLLERLNREAEALRHTTASQPMAAEVDCPPRRKILVVDDDPFMLKAIRLRLEACGAEVLQACDGEQAYEIAYWQDVDLIVTDYIMPRGSGEYLLARLRANTTTREIPVIVVTQCKVEGRKDHALARDMLGRLEAAAYLEKPLDLDALVAEVRHQIVLPG